MKKQLEDNKSVKSSNNTTVDNKTQPTQRDASGSSLDKSWRENVKHSYKTVKSQLVKDDISTFLKTEDKEVTERLNSRKIKVSSIKSISKQIQHLLINGKIKNISTKYYLKLNSGDIKIINLSQNK